MSNPPALSSHTSVLPERPHILYLVDQLTELGGGERVLLTMVRSLPRDRFVCSLATFRSQVRKDELRDVLASLRVYPLRRTYDWNALKTALQLRAWIRANRVSIVHTFFETSDLWGGLVAKLSGVPVLVSSRRDMGILRLPKHRVAYRLMAPLYDRVLAVSEKVRQYCIREDKLNPDKVTVLHNGIDLARVDAQSATEAAQAWAQIDPDAPVIATVAHIRHVKGIDVLVRAAALVCHEVPRAQFCVIGRVLEEDCFRALQGLIRKLGVEKNVRFLGGSPDVIPLLKLSQIFCLLSRSEGFSNAIIEAMACRLPCVVTRVGGNDEAVHEGVSGFLVEPESAEAAAARLLTLLRQPELARKMGDAGRRTAEERFTLQGMIEQLAAIYQDLLQSCR